MSTTSTTAAGGSNNGGSEPPTTGGRGSGRARGNVGGRGRRNASNTSNQPRFEGREPSLRGYIYDFTGERAPDQYIKTTKEVINYVGRTYTKYTSDFTQAMSVLALEDPVSVLLISVVTQQGRG